MLTKKSYKYLSHHYTIGYHSCALPFRWDSKLKKLCPVKSRIRLFIWYLNMVASSLLTFRLIYTFTMGVWNENRPLAQLIVDFLYIMPYSSQFGFNFTLIFQRDEVVGFINRLIKLDQMLTGIYSKKSEDDCHLDDLNDTMMQEDSNPGSANALINRKPKKKKEKTDGCDDNIFASTYMMFVYSALSVSMFLRNPNNSRYLYSSLKSPVENLTIFEPDSNSDGIFDTILQIDFFKYTWAGLEYFQLVKFCLAFNNVFYILTLYTHCTNFWLHELSRPKDGVQKTITKEVEAQNVVKLYKYQQVLNVHFNHCSSDVLLPTFKLLNIGLHIMAIYVTISFHDRIPIGGYLIFPIGFVMWSVIEKDVYPLLGNTDELSREYLASWQPHMGFEAWRDFKPLFPLGVKVSFAYSIDKSTVLSVWSIIFNNVINLFLM